MATDADVLFEEVEVSHTDNEVDNETSFTTPDTPISVEQPKKRRQRHLTVRYFKCDVCARSFASFFYLKRHLTMANHTKTRIMCTVCNTCFPSASEANEHMETVHKYNKFTCEVCGQSFKRKVLLKGHMLRHMETSIKCHECHSFFETNEAMDRHYKKVHGLHHLCTICGKSFNLKKMFTRHMQIHTGEAFKYICEYEGCERKFARLDLYNDHVNSHTGVAPYSCTKCGRSFSIKNTLQKHEKSCETPGMHMCDLCPKRYDRASILKAHHQAVHQHKLFFCSCGKQFAYKCNLYTHKVTKNH